MIAREEFESVSAHRISLYRLVSKLFRAPLAQAEIEELAAMDLVRAGADAGGCGHGLKVMGLSLEKRNTGTREMLARDFTSAFLGVQEAEGKVALPFESAFSGDDQRYMGEARGRVYNIYKRCALKLSEGVNLPEDHLSFMADFMVTMTERAVALRRRSDEDGLRQNLLVQRAFLDRHIRSWYPAFAHVAEAIVQNRFYRGALEFAGDVFDLDAKVLKDLLSGLGAARQSFDLSLWELSRPPQTAAALSYPVLDRRACLQRKGMECTACRTACPEGIDPVVGDRAPQNGCTHCGACVAACPTGALSFPGA